MDRTSGVTLIAAERARQKIEVAYGGEGYGPDHDLGHDEELAMAAACYAMPALSRMWLPTDEVPMHWPWAGRFWKPTPADRVRELTKAGALIAAAIDSILDTSGVGEVAS